MQVHCASLRPITIVSPTFPIMLRWEVGHTSILEPAAGSARSCATGIGRYTVGSTKLREPH